MSITERETTPPTTEPANPKARLRRLRTATLPLALALALTLSAFAVRLLDSDSSTAMPADRALVDAESTTKVLGDVGNALTKIFSYDHRDPEATQRTADQVLTGNAAAQYRALFGSVRTEAPRQRLTLTTRLVRIGVIDLRGDTARLLVFLDQQATRGGKSSGGVAPAQLTVTAQRTSGVWRISDLRAS